MKEGVGRKEEIITLPLEIFFIDYANDFVLFKPPSLIKDFCLPGSIIGNSEQLKSGRLIFSMPYVSSLRTKRGRIEILSAKKEAPPHSRSDIYFGIKFCEEVCSGESGSPVFVRINGRYKLIGILQARSVRSAKIGIAMRINHIISVLKKHKGIDLSRLKKNSAV